MKQNKTISENQLKEAVKRFETQGGLIWRLPDQVTPLRNLVGENHNALENIYYRMAAEHFSL